MSQRTFNVTGSCFPDRHYVVDISAKLDKALALVRAGQYFAVNRPRQFGKTSLLVRLRETLRSQCLTVPLSFEGAGGEIFEDPDRFAPGFVNLLADRLEFSAPEMAERIRQLGTGVCDFRALSRFISRLARDASQPVVLLIDEVDKSSNNQLFVKFLGLLRDKYLLQASGDDATFHSVVLAGVHDVKSLKLRLRDENEAKLNSPWNIAVDFDVDMSFSPAEIKTMLADYATDKGVAMDFDAVAERLRYYTGGYPFLVSKMCKDIDEQAARENPDYDATHWTVADVDWAFRWLTRPMYRTTNFDDLIKNIENSGDLYAMVRALAVEGRTFSATADNPLVGLALTYGILAEREDGIGIANRVYEQRIATYLQSKQETSGLFRTLSVPDVGYVVEGHLQLGHVLEHFQAFMREHYSDRDAAFLEREGRLIFMSFLRPIINGRGFLWKEPVVGDERRMDLVVTFGGKQKDVVELKVWRGEAYHQRGLDQLSDYLDFQGLKTGFLLVFDFHQEKQYRLETITHGDKSLFAVWV